ncbi:MAG: transglycosylase domain-containing protein [Solobacterium sp.]|nr:transglycosylase domain-containing protein [Solobacterium sp.]
MPELPAVPGDAVRTADAPAVRDEQKLELFSESVHEQKAGKAGTSVTPPDLPKDLILTEEPAQTEVTPPHLPEPAVESEESDDISLFFPELAKLEATAQESRKERLPEDKAPAEPQPESETVTEPVRETETVTKAAAEEPDETAEQEAVIVPAVKQEEHSASDNLSEEHKDIQPAPKPRRKKTHVQQKGSPEPKVKQSDPSDQPSAVKNNKKSFAETVLKPRLTARKPKKESGTKSGNGEPLLRYRSGKILLGIFAGFMILGVVAGFAGTMWFENLIENAPPLDVGKREEYSQASVIYDHDGNFVAEYGTNENVEWAESNEIPQQLKDAFIAIEDQRFYEHNGIDLKRLVGAVIGQITGNASYGASTITQQLIKNTHLTQEVSYERKASEIHLALELEKVMSKDDILVWYMNTLYLGDSNYGVKVAAEDYFGKKLSQLSLRECAILAGLAQSPNAYNPRLNSLKGDMTPTNRRANNVLFAMHKTGKINDTQYEAALNEHLNVLEQSRRYELYNYPIYVEYAVENVATKLLEAEETEITDEALTEKKQWLRTAGYQIYTGFNTGIQDTAQEAITSFDRYPTLITGTEVQASTVIMDQRTGEVVAMVGGREEPTAPEGFNRATDSTQAVGSSIKPLSVYAPACETGDYPGTTVMDTQESIQGYGEDNSYPNGDHTGGAITMRRALELSHNIPAARFLLEHVGIDKAYNFMVQEGFSPENLSKTAAGLALGATDVTTLEMTAAYACLANGGEYIEPHAYRKVTDRFGNLILDGNNVEKHRVFSESTAWLVTNMMETNMVDGYGVNARLSNVKSCGKTGTHEHQVISFGGYTPYYTSFLRISADDYVRMTNSSSYYQSAPLWRAYMEPIHEGLEDREILDYTAEDVGIQQYWVCTNSGQLAQSWCEGHYEYAAPNNAPTVVCEGHTYAEPEWTEENWSEGGFINYDDPNWWEKGWWDEMGNFHPY